MKADLLALMGASLDGWLIWLVVLALASYPPPVSASSLRGVSPQDEKYFLGPLIACKDGTATFSKDRLNDGFCDCADGTDEPGTSACPEGKFYCRNSGDTPHYLFSSRVNDKICDCCDGSDEYDSGTYCPNTCRKDHNVSEHITVRLDSVSSNVNDLGRQGRNTMVDLEDLKENFLGLRFFILMQLVCLMIVVCWLRHRHSIVARRKYISKQ